MYLSMHGMPGFSLTVLDTSDITPLAGVDLSREAMSTNTFLATYHASLLRLMTGSSQGLSSRAGLQAGDAAHAV